MAQFVSSGAEDPSQGRASDRPSPRPAEAQPAGDAPRHREEGKEGSRETLGPDGFPVSENQSAQQSDSSVGLITNRPPSKTNTGGEDWFEVSLYVRHSDFDALSAQLDAAREAAEDGREGEDVVTFNGVRFLVRPSGASAGKGQKRIYYRWQLQSENGLLIQVMNREHPHRTMPNASVRATSVLLMQFGADRIWQEAQGFLEAMGCTIERNKLSRVDPCVDLPGMSINALCSPFVCGHYVTRARANSRYEYEDYIVSADSSVHSLGRELSGFVVGQDQLKLRVYNKVREANLVPEKIAAVVNCRWGYWTATASRVEFQIRRDALKDFGVDTVADWFAKRAEICEYLCTQWFRLTSGPVDRDHADRAETLAEWLLVQQAFAAWAGKPDYICLESLMTEECQPTHLLQQVAGLLVSYYARTGTKIKSTPHFLEVATSKLTKTIGPRDVLAEIQRRALELGLLPAPFKEFESELRS